MKRFALFVAAMSAAVGCKGGDDKKQDTSEESGVPTDTPTDSATDTNTAAGTLAVDFDAPGKMMQVMGSAMVSVAEVKSEAGVSLNPGSVALSTGSLALSADEFCTHSGSPSVQGKTGGEFAAYSAYCDLAKHPDGPDSTLGGIDRVQGLLCAIEGQFAYDGKETEVNVELIDKCFSQEFLAMAKDQGITAVKQIVLAKDAVDAAFGNTGYDKSLELKLAPGEKEGFVYNVLLSKKDDVLSAAVVGGLDEDPAGPDFFAITLDTSPQGSIRYEGRFSKFSDQNAPKGRHLRVLAKGTYDQTKQAFTTVDGLDYVYWDTYPAYDQSSEVSDGLRTVHGSPGNGYKALSFTSTPAYVLANYKVEGEDAFCYAGDCAGNDGLYPTQEADFAFPKHVVQDDQTYYGGLKFFKEQGPLQFDGVAFTGEP